MIFQSIIHDSRQYSWYLFYQFYKVNLAIIYQTQHFHVLISISRCWYSLSLTLHARISHYAKLYVGTSVVDRTPIQVNGNLWLFPRRNTRLYGERENWLTRACIATTDTNAANISRISSSGALISRDTNTISHHTLEKAITRAFLQL